MIYWIAGVYAIVSGVMGVWSFWSFYDGTGMRRVCLAFGVFLIWPLVLMVETFERIWNRIR